MFLFWSLERIVSFSRGKISNQKCRATKYLDHLVDTEIQGYNARKVILEVYASFDLQCTVSGRNSKPYMVSIFHIKKNQFNILVIGNYHVNYQNYQNLMLLTSSDTERTLMHLFHPERTGFNYVRRVAECTQL